MASMDLLDVEDKARLELTLRTREMIINQMVKDNKLPESEEDRNFLMKALDGMDRTVLTKTKIKVDDSAAKGQMQTAKIISDVLLRINANNTNARRTEPVILDAPTPILVEGEEHIGVQTFRYSEIMGDRA